MTEKEFKERVVARNKTFGVPQVQSKAKKVFADLIKKKCPNSMNGLCFDIGQMGWGMFWTLTNDGKLYDSDGGQYNIEELLTEEFFEPDFYSEEVFGYVLLHNGDMEYAFFCDNKGVWYRDVIDHTNRYAEHIVYMEEIGSYRNVITYLENRKTWFLDEDGKTKAKLGTTIIGGDKEATEDRYDDMLGAVPPIYCSSIDGVGVRGGFAVGEAYSHNNKGETIYYGFYQVGDKYYETLVKFVSKGKVVRVAENESLEYKNGANIGTTFTYSIGGL
jgi:hypothetical protein